MKNKKSEIPNRRQLAIDGKLYGIASTFPVLWHAWECDSEGYVVDRDGRVAIVFTNHGSPYFPSSEEIQERLDLYRNAAEAIEPFL